MFIILIISNIFLHYVFPALLYEFSKQYRIIDALNTTNIFKYIYSN